MARIKAFVCLALICFLESGVIPGAAADQEKPCTEKLTERLRATILARGIQNWPDSFKEQNDLSSYENVRVDANGVAGWLVTAGCAHSRGTVLVWISSDGKIPKLEAPLASLGEAWWDFLSVEKVGDFDRNGSVDALLVGTGGAGMYYHYPILISLGSNNHWDVLYAEADSFFYGSTEVLSPTPDGKIRIAVTSVDKGAPFAFAQCSLCWHPYKREEFVVVKRTLDLIKKTPVPSGVSTISNLITAARKRNFDAVYQLFETKGSINGVMISSSGIRAALTSSRLTDVNHSCYEIHEDAREGQMSTQTLQGKKIVEMGSPVAEPDTFRFGCPIDKADAEYTAQVTRDGNDYRIHSLTLVRIVRY